MLSTGIISIIVSAISSIITWLFTRRKYDSEVDDSLIANMQNSLEFYKKLSDDNKARLDDMLKRNLLLEAEVSSIRKQMFKLMSSICVDFTCQIRKKDNSLISATEDIIINNNKENPNEITT